MCLNEVTKTVIPIKGLRSQKRWMRYYLHKTDDFGAKDFVAREREINDHLQYFPPELNIDQKLPESELKEVLEYAIPPHWQKRMILLGFDPAEKALQDFSDFCYRMEKLELV